MTSPDQLSLSLPPSRRGDVLVLAWINDVLSGGIVRKGSIVSSWRNPEPVANFEAFAAALDHWLTQGLPAGDTIFILENERFAHRTESIPPGNAAIQRAYIQKWVQRHQAETGPVLWTQQRPAPTKTEEIAVLHLLPEDFYSELQRILSARKIRLRSLLPVAPLLEHVPLPSSAADEVSLLAFDLGQTTAVAARNGASRLLFGRSLATSWLGDPQRGATEINRSMLFARQHFGAAIRRIILVGDASDDVIESLRAKLGSGLELATQPAPLEKLFTTAAGIPVRHHANLMAAHLNRQSRRRLIRVASLATVWCFCLLSCLAFWSSEQSWSNFHRTVSRLREREPAEQKQLQALLQRNARARAAQTLLDQLNKNRLPPVAPDFIDYLATCLPNNVRLVSAEVNWQTDSTWHFQLSGSGGENPVDADVVNGLKRTLRKSPFAARFDKDDTLADQIGIQTSAPDTNEFKLEGTLLAR